MWMIAVPVCALLLAAMTPPNLGAVSGGGTLAAPGGLPVFPSLAGRPVAGIAGAFGDARDLRPFGRDHDILIMRAYGCLAAYAIRHGDPTCVGEIRCEPRDLPDPAGAERRLRKAGFQVRRGFLATAGATFAIDAGFFEKRAKGWVERYVLVREEAEPGQAPRQRLAEAAFYPQDLGPGLEPWAVEGRRALAEHFASRVRR